SRGLLIPWSWVGIPPGSPPPARSGRSAERELELARWRPIGADHDLRPIGIGRPMAGLEDVVHAALERTLRVEPQDVERRRPDPDPRFVGLRWLGPGDPQVVADRLGEALH